jgi:stage V sporulation protein AA
MISSLVTGEGNPGALWISIPYSIGIGLGVLFFTGLGRRRTNPNFFELEEREYQSKVDKYLQKDETGESGDA